MKTNVTMMSNDRKLFGVTIRQDTKNQFLSITDLQEAYTRARIEKDGMRRGLKIYYLTIRLLSVYIISLINREL